MKTLICSDVHLEDLPEGQANLKEFVAFLKDIDAGQFNRLILLGDLFDFWFEYRHVIFSGYFDVLRALADLHDRGVELHLVCGNHDFWAGRFLENHLKMTVHHNDFRCTFGTQRALFIHGDGIDKRDYGYRLFKYLARSRLAVGLFGLIHPDWAMAIARKVSSASRSVQKDAEPGNDRAAHAIARFAQEVIEAGEADAVLCGHSHHATRMEFETPDGPGVYINTGAWKRHRDYVEWDGEVFTQKQFTSAQES